MPTYKAMKMPENGWWQNAYSTTSITLLSLVDTYHVLSNDASETSRREFLKIPIQNSPITFPIGRFESDHFWPLDKVSRI